MIEWKLLSIIIFLGTYEINDLNEENLIGSFCQKELLWSIL